MKKLSEGELEISGDMSIKGIVKPVTLVADFAGIAVDPYGQTKAGMSLTGKIIRSDFDLTWGAVTEAGNIVVVTGIVTGQHKNDCNQHFIQSESGAWNGIYIYGGCAPERGTLVTIQGQVQEYYEITADYNDLIEPFSTQYQNEEITLEEYQSLTEDDYNQYLQDSEEHILATILFFRSALIYYISAFTILYYVYSVFTKGHTLGRKMMKIELQGNITWWTLLVREIIWKTGYYMLTLLIGGIIIDVLMISFSNKKLAPRDYVTKITVKYEGADYPF